MEFIVPVLRMNGGEKETSYAKNSCLQRQMISLSDSIIDQAVAKCLNTKTLTTSMGIADLGCSSGPNSLMVISNIINTVVTTCSQIGIPLPEMRVSLNDLPGNDFNNIFMSLPEFYSRMKREKGIHGCYVSCVGGSFYGRLFPANSQHLIHTSSSLHWLSQVPPGLDENVAGKHLNKGKIYISKTSPPCVAKAYLLQFQKDFFQFLRSRAEETVPGGRMVLSFMGRVSPDPSAMIGSHQWELLAQSLMSMASDGLVKEEKIDAFNAPYYSPSAEEVKSIIREEGSFIIDHLEICVVRWDEGFSNDAFDYEIGGKLSRGQQFAKLIRAVVESMLECAFGAKIMDELFRRYGHLVDDCFAKTTPKYINLVISLARSD